jgi:hypothetical protein
MLSLRVSILAALIAVFGAPANTYAQSSSDASVPSGQTQDFTNGKSAIYYREKKILAEQLAKAFIDKYKDKTNDPEYTKVQLLYITASSKYNAYLGQALDDVSSGKKEDLTSSANAAAPSAQAFYDEVNKALQTKSVSADFTTVSQLIQAAVGLYDFFVKRKKQERDAWVAQAKPAMIWAEWSALSSPAPQLTKSGAGKTTDDTNKTDGSAKSKSDTSKKPQ